MKGTVFQGIKNVFRFEIRLHRFTFLWCGLGVFLFQGVMVGFFAAFRPEEMLGVLFRKAAFKIFRSLLGGDYIDPMTVSGFLSFAFTHPLNLILLSAPVIAAASCTAAGGAEEGKTDFLLSQPLSRTALLTSRMAACVCGAVFMTLCMWLGHIVATTVIPLPELPGRLPFLYAAVNAFFLLLGIQGIAFLTAAGAANRSLAVGITIAVLAAMLLVQLGTQFWDPCRIVATVAVFTYYIPAKSVRFETLQWGDLAALSCFFLFLSGLALVVFRKKDI
jgi:ABC-type transport system involved in multi-copper enzyme maturation permease subunit